MKALTTFVCLLVLAFLALPLLSVELGIGHKAFTISVHVADEGTGTAIENAEVLLRQDGLALPPPSYERFQSAKTLNGEVEFVEEFPIYTRDSIFTHSSTVGTSFHLVQVIHPNYEPYWAKLVDFPSTQRSANDTSPIRCDIRLKRRNSI